MRLYEEMLRREKLTSRQWKTRKRKDAKELEKACWQFLTGAAFTPCKDVGVMLLKIREYRKQLSVKNWGK